MQKFCFQRVNLIYWKFNKSASENQVSPSFALPFKSWLFETTICLQKLFKNWNFNNSNILTEFPSSFCWSSRHFEVSFVDWYLFSKISQSKNLFTNFVYNNTQTPLKIHISHHLFLGSNVPNLRTHWFENFTEVCSKTVMKFLGWFTYWLTKQNVKIVNFSAWFSIFFRQITCCFLSSQQSTVSSQLPLTLAHKFDKARPFFE